MQLHFNSLLSMQQKDFALKSFCKKTDNCHHSQTFIERALNFHLRDAPNYRAAPSATLALFPLLFLQFFFLPFFSDINIVQCIVIAYRFSSRPIPNRSLPPSTGKKKSEAQRAQRSTFII